MIARFPGYPLDLQEKDFSDMKESLIFFNKVEI